MIDAHNDVRERHGLPPLAFDPVLQSLAEGHALDMAEHGRMSHDSSDGTPFTGRTARKGLGNVEAYENVAQGQKGVDSVMAAWMVSPDHAGVILNPRVNSIGAACVEYPLGTIFWCVVFANLGVGGLAVD